MRNRFLNIAAASILGISLLGSPVILSSCASEKTISDRKLEKERKKKAKEAEKKYKAAVKHHMDQQSKSTKSMMKSSKKNSPENTPLKTSSGTKCK